jgi:hypothetical protein
MARHSLSSSASVLGGMNSKEKDWTPEASMSLMDAGTGVVMLRSGIHQA